MKPEEINRAIAEELGVIKKTGWYCPRCDEHEIPWTHVSNDECHDVTGCGTRVLPEEDSPNYHGSLDACAEMEGTLTDDEHWEQVKILTDWIPAPMGFPLLGRSQAIALKTATAPQRCVAFLRVKGLWK